MEPTKPYSLAPYLDNISAHRKRVQMILLLAIVGSLTVVSLTNEPYKLYALPILGVALVYHFVYWYILVNSFKKKTAIMLAVSVYNVLFTVASVYVPWLSFLPLLLLISTLVVFDPVRTLVMAILEILFYDLIIMLGFWHIILTPPLSFPNLILFHIIITTVGVMSSITTFEVQEREAKMVRLEELDSIRNTFIALISHNLRTPLTPIVGYTALLKDKITSPETATMFSSLEISVQRLSQITEDIVNIAELETGERQLQLERFNAYEVINEIVSTTYMAMAKDKFLTLTVFNPDTQVVTVTADRSQFKILVGLLIDNAIKFTSQGGITITCEQQGSKMLLSVADTGKGMAEEFQKQIFSPFTREANVLIYNEQGIGLGIYAAKIIVTAHHGEISLHSETGKGTTFYVRLPS